MNHNFTRTAQPTPEELASRQAWYDQQMAEAAKVNEAAMLAGQQQREHEFQAELVAKTGLSESTLIAIRNWLNHNPSRIPAGIVESYEEIR
jgi:hypothetical protein